MPRCSCPGSSCNCAIVGGRGVVVEGAGTASSPYTLSLANAYLYVEKTVASALNLDNIANGTVVEVSVEANVTSVVLPDMPPGTQFTLIFRFNAVGVTVTFDNGNVKWVGGSQPAFTTTNNSFTIVTITKSNNFFLAVMEATGILV